MHSRIVRRKSRTGRNDPELLLPRKPFLTHGIPARVESAAVFFQIIPRRLMRRMSRTEREIQEERTFRYERRGIANEGDRTIDDILRQVVAVRGGARRFDEMIVAG
jgi:hypothetical protein